MRERRKTFSRSTFKKQVDILDGRSIYANNEWTDWLRSKKSDVMDRLMQMTIMEYKKGYINRLPDWAKPFSQKGISTSDITKESDKYYRHVSGTGRDRRFMEREIVENDGSTILVVERIFNARGHCKQITVIIPEGNGIFKYRQEDWVSGGKWIVRIDHSFKSFEGFYTDSDFMKSTVSWFEMITNK